MIVAGVDDFTAGIVDADCFVSFKTMYGYAISVGGYTDVTFSSFKIGDVGGRVVDEYKVKVVVALKRFGNERVFVKSVGNVGAIIGNGVDLPGFFGLEFDYGACPSLVGVGD